MFDQSSFWVCCKGGSGERKSHLHPDNGVNRAFGYVMNVVTVVRCKDICWVVIRYHTTQWWQSFLDSFTSTCREGKYNIQYLQSVSVLPSTNSGLIGAGEPYGCNNYKSVV